MGKYSVNIVIGGRSIMINPAKFSVGVVSPWKLWGAVILLLLETLQ